ncbi:lymphocyte antigen 6H-like [Macrotis lagotis]|uniref:lymphocyte antigen 6H-like n=1 Tax=Macrotis lagotis TaxID=92651 RepID=UPI003D6915F0
MRVLLPVLLSILLYIEPVPGLKCYNCTGIKESSQCSLTHCAGSAARCGSLEAKEKSWTENRMIYFKGCATNCESFFMESLRKAIMEIPADLIEVGYTCCAKEQCNGADGFKGSPLALMGALLLSLGPAFLWVFV